MDDDAGPQASMERPQASIESLTATFQDLFDKQGTPISQTLGGSAATATDDGAHLRSSIMDDDDAGPQSLFLVVSWNGFAPYYNSILKLETQIQKHEYASSSANAPVEISAHIRRLPQVPFSWAISLPPASSTEDLYFLPDCLLTKREIENGREMPGFIVNLNTKKCKIIKPNLAPKLTGLAVTIGDHIYFMAHPCFYCRSDAYAYFERYDTLSQSWEVLLPLFSDCGDGIIAGYAVLDDTILFNFLGKKKKMWAYNVGRNNWYPVNVHDILCYKIEGGSVVVNKIIYVLTLFCDSIVALTLKSQEIEGDLVFTCDLHKVYVVPGMELEPEDEFWDSDNRTRHLVHLGKDNFCVVRSYIIHGISTQSIHLTYIEVSEEKLIVTNRCVHEFKLRPVNDNFVIRHCFSMPKCKTTAVEEGNKEQEAEIVTLPPELEQFLDKFSSQKKIIDEQGGGSVSQTSQNGDDADTITQVQEVAAKSDIPSKWSTIIGHEILNDATIVDSHSICVTNLPSDVNRGKLLMRLFRFGDITRFHFRVDDNNLSEAFAVVEFESVTSKEKAIKASIIKIGGRKAVIEEKRSFTPGGDSNIAEKLKKHGMDSRPKTIRQRLSRMIPF